MVSGPVRTMQRRARPAQHPAENIDARRQPVALVRPDLARRAQGQHQEVLRRGPFVHHRRAVGLGHPAGQHVRAKALRQPDLVPRQGTHRRVEDEGRLVAGRRGDRDRVQSHPRLRPERRRDQQPPNRHRDADHVVRQRELRVVGRRPDVRALRREHRPHAAVAGLLDRDLHRLRPDREAQPAVRIHHRRGRVVARQRHLRRRVNRAVPEAGDVVGHHVADAVRVDPAVVGVHQAIHRPPHVVVGHAELAEDVADGSAHHRRLHSHGDVVGHTELFQHGWSFRVLPGSRPACATARSRRAPAD